MKNVLAAIQKLTAPLHRRVRLMVSRAVLKLVDDTKTLQTLQLAIHADELRDDAERFQQYGFSSHPKVGAEAIVLMVGGSADHPVVVAVDDRRYRPKTLAEGESCLYTLGNGIRVLCKADGSIEVGTTPTDFVALASLVAANFSALQTRFLAFEAALAAGFTAAGGAPLTGVAAGSIVTAAVAGSVYPVPTAVAATQVKAK